MARVNVITVKEAAERSGYHPEYIRRLIRDGKIAAEKLGTVYLVDAESLQAYLRFMQDPDDARTGPR